MKFSELFEDKGNGQVSPKQPIKLGGLFMGKGSTISKNVTMNGINLAAAWDKDLVTRMDGETVVIDRMID